MKKATSVAGGAYELTAEKIAAAASETGAEALRASRVKRVPRLRRMSHVQDGFPYLHGLSVEPISQTLPRNMWLKQEMDATDEPWQSGERNTALSPVHRTSVARIGNPLPPRVAKQLSAVKNKTAAQRFANQAPQPSPSTRTLLVALASAESRVHKRFTADMTPLKSNVYKGLTMKLKTLVATVAALATLGACVNYDVTIPQDRRANTVVSPELRTSLLGTDYWTEIDAFGGVPDNKQELGASVCSALDTSRFTYSPMGYHPNVIANARRVEGFFCSRTES